MDQQSIDAGRYDGHIRYERAIDQADLARKEAGIGAAPDARYILLFEPHGAYDEPWCFEGAPLTWSALLDTAAEYEDDFPLAQAIRLTDGKDVTGEVEAHLRDVARDSYAPAVHSSAGLPDRELATA